MSNQHSSPNPDQFSNRDDASGRSGYQQIERQSNQQTLQTPPQVLIVLILLMIALSAAAYLRIRGEFAQKENIDLLKKIQTGLHFHLVKDQALSPVELEPVDPAKEKISMGATAGAQAAMYYKLEKMPAISGSSVKVAGLGKDEIGTSIINIEFDAAGAALFADVTAKNIGFQLAMVYNDRVISAPVIQSKIDGGKAQISGKDIALILEDIQKAEDGAASATTQAESR